MAGAVKDCGLETDNKCICQDEYCADSKGRCHKGPHMCNDKCGPINSCQSLCSNVANAAEAGQLSKLCYGCLALYYPVWDSCCDCIDVCGLLDYHKELNKTNQTKDDSPSFLTSVPYDSFDPIAAEQQLDALPKHVKDCPVFFGRYGLMLQILLLAVVLGAVISFSRFFEPDIRVVTHDLAVQLCGMLCAIILDVLFILVFPALITVPGGCGWYMVDLALDSSFTVCSLIFLQQWGSAGIVGQLKTFIAWGAFAFVMKAAALTTMAIAGKSLVGLLAVHVLPHDSTALLVCVVLWPAVTMLWRMLIANKLLKGFGGKSTNQDGSDYTLLQ